MEKYTKGKKMLALLLSVCMVWSIFASPAGLLSVTAEEAQSHAALPGLIASYPLLTDVKDSSGHGYDGKEVGTIRYYNGITFPGNKDSSTNYVELPQGMLDKKDALTISVWLKNRTGKGNYAALSFCSPTTDNSNSPNYWLFVPSNPAGLFKNVFTNGVNLQKPFQTEVGVTAGDTTGLERLWAQYTMVLTAESVTSYLNGTLVGTAPKARTTTDFGENLRVYLGRSGYAGDQAFAGSMKNLNIYDGALTSGQVQAEYEAHRKAFDLENESAGKEPEGITEYIPQIQEEVDQATGLIHPGIGISAKQLRSMQEHVRAGEEPWLSGYEVLRNNPKAALYPRLYFQADNDIFIHIPGPWAMEGYSNPGDFVSQRCQMDSLTAAHQALMWYITGNEQYRKNVFAILDNFAKVESAVDHTDFRFGGIVYNLCFAAEILRYTACDSEELKWTQEDTDHLTGFISIVHKFYDATWFWMNQHSFNVLGMMGESLFTNDFSMYGKAVERTLVNTEGTHGGCNGSVKYQIREMCKNDLTGEALSVPNIQLMEMGRDQGHAYGNLGGLSQLVQSIYTQGTMVDPETGTISTAENAVNPFHFLDDRLLAGASYLAKFHLGYDVVWIPAETGKSSSSPNGIYKSINEGPWKGNLSNYYGIVYNYYKYIDHADMTQEKYRYVAEAYESIFPEGASGDFIALSTLLFTPDSAAEDGISRKKDYSQDTETISQTEYYSALRRGTAEILTEGDTTFVRADATKEGTEFAIRYFGFPNKGIAALKVRSTGNAKIRLGCQKPEHEAAGVFEVHDTKGEWQYVFCDFSKSKNTDGTMTYYTITGDAAQVDLDYLDFAPTRAVPQIREIRQSNPIISSHQKDGTEKGYLAVGETYQSEIVLESAMQGVVYSVQGLPEHASFDQKTGTLQWTPSKEQSGRDYTVCYSAQKDGTVTYCRKTIYVYETAVQLLSECAKEISSGEYEQVSTYKFQSAYQAALEEGRQSCVSEAFKQKVIELIQFAENLPYEMYSYDFEGSSVTEQLQNKRTHREALQLCGGAQIVYDKDRQSNVLSFNGVYGTCAKLPEDLLKGRDSFTISMDVKAVKEDGRIFSLGSSETCYFGITGGITQLASQIARSGLSCTAEKAFDVSCENKWISIAVEVKPDSLRLYKDGRLIAENYQVDISVEQIGDSLMGMLGQSFHIEDTNFCGCLDNIRIYRGTYQDSLKQTAKLDMEELVVRFLKIQVTPPKKKAYQIGEKFSSVGMSVKAVYSDGYKRKVDHYQMAGFDSKKAGTKTITIQYTEENITKTAKFKVTVKKPPLAVKKVTLNLKKATIGMKETLSLKASKTPSKAKTTYQWKSSAPKVVSVTKGGKIKGLKSGNAVITVKSANGKKASCKITVKKAPKKVFFSKKSLTLKKGKSAKLKVKFSSKSASWKLTFSSNKKSVAVVSNTGKVTAKKRGTAKITVKTYNGKKASITVRVK